MSQSSEATASENSELILLKKLIEIIDGGDQVISLQDEKQAKQQAPTTPSLLRTALFGDEQAYFHHKKHQTHSSSSSTHITTLITDDVDFEIVNEGAYNNSTNGFGNDLLNGDLTITTGVDEASEITNANDFDDECDAELDLSKSNTKWLDESKLNEDDFQINETEVNQSNEREIQILELFKQRRTKSLTST